MSCLTMSRDACFTCACVDNHMGGYLAATRAFVHNNHPQHNHVYVIIHANVYAKQRCLHPAVSCPLCLSKYTRTHTCMEHSVALSTASRLVDSCSPVRGANIIVHHVVLNCVLVCQVVANTVHFFWGEFLLVNHELSHVHGGVPCSRCCVGRVYSTDAENPECSSYSCAYNIDWRDNLS
jgi:hypothetical protein